MQNLCSAVGGPVVNQGRVEALQAGYVERAKARTTTLDSLYRMQRTLGPAFSQKYGVPFEVRTISNFE